MFASRQSWNLAKVFVFALRKRVVVFRFLVISARVLVVLIGILAFFSTRIMGWFHAWKEQTILLWPELVTIALFFGEQLLHELVVGVLQLLVHAGHDADVVVVDQVHFFIVEVLWQLPCLVGEKEVANCLCLKGQLRTQSHCIHLACPCLICSAASPC